VTYEVYATRWDNPHIVEERIPASGLEFTMPLSDHGEASFSATVEPGRSFWRPALSVAVSGILICRDDVPVWSGRVWSEKQTGPRTFDFTCAEWGSFFERVPPVPKVYSQQNDHDIFRDLIDQAQAVSGQNVQVQHRQPLTRGTATSDLTINWWDDTTVEAQFRLIADAAGGPEWYFNTGGTLANPTRVLVLGDRLGRTDPVTVLEYVEDTESWSAPSSSPTSTPLGNVYPGQQPHAVVGGRRGGNVIAHPARSQDATTSATATIAIGAGDQAAQLRATAQATDLLAAGFPRQTVSAQYSDVDLAATIVRHVEGDLAASRGMVTSYTFTTFDGDPDWTQVQRGDTVRVELDTDVYASERPLVFKTRILEVGVSVQDNGPAQVNWKCADVRDY